MRVGLPPADSTILFLAAGGMLVSAIGYGWAAARPRAPVSGASIMTAAYVPSVQTWKAPAAHEWNAPESGFDPFAAAVRRVAAGDPAESAARVPLGIELMAINPEPFPIRLIGVVRDDTDWRGAFEQLSDGEVTLASPGATISQGRLQIESIHVGGIRPTAVVKTLDSDRLVELSAGSPGWTGNWTATLRDANGVHECRVGAELVSAEHRYRIESIAQGSVTLLRDGPNESSIQRHELHLATEEPQ